MGRGCGRLHFYPRSPCGERLARCRCWVLSNAISIHALLAESDPEQLRTVRVSSSQDFYPRSPCGERPISTVLLLPPTKFLSTLSLRRATRHSPIFRYRQEPFLSTLSLRRATAPQGSGRSRGVFLSTLSLRRATEIFLAQNFRHSISIHALLAESDFPGIVQLGFHPHFYPRSPCGERLTNFAEQEAAAIFLSTLSLRRATFRFGGRRCGQKNFYPRSPCGERLCVAAPSCGT